VIETLHFLRPAWLLLLPAIAIAWRLIRRLENRPERPLRLFAPHLQAALTINPETDRGLRPIDGIAAMLVCTALAAAGPSWTRDVAPWFEEQAPLIIALEVSDSMRSNDLQPTRLDRARFKILDLVAERTGARTALIAYAGTAHIVVPPTRDIEVLKPLLESLDPEIMPAGGSNASAVLPLVERLQQDMAGAGTLLFVNDGFEAMDIPALSAYAAGAGSAALVALVAGTAEGGNAFLADGTAAMSGARRVDTRVDEQQLRRVAAETDMEIVRLETGAGDIRQLLGHIASRQNLADSPGARWRDEAWWLLWPAAVLALLWFRRGWTTRW
jgi:Ca-activated chloride channel family protein